MTGMTPLELNLSPTCMELAKLNGRLFTNAEGKDARLDLIPEKCRDHHPGNTVDLVFTLGDIEASVWMMRRVWDVEQVVRSIGLALRNGSLADSATRPFALDEYR
jgi:hypothetical protein